MYKDLPNCGQGWITETDPNAIAADASAAGGLVSFSAVNFTEDQPSDKDYPLMAILGTLRFHLGSGTRSTCSQRMRRFGLRGEVEISPEDGANLNLLDGDTVRIVSQHGVIQRAIRMEESVGPGQIFIPLAVNKNDAVNLINLSEPTASDFTGLKTCHVRLEKI
jgi:formate dehydrogenase alpha subunit